MVITKSDVDKAVQEFQSSGNDYLLSGNPTLWKKVGVLQAEFEAQKTTRKPLLISEGPYYDNDIYGLYMVPPSVDLENGFGVFCDLYDYSSTLDHEDQNAALDNMIELGLIEKRDGYAERDVFRAYLAWLCREDVIERIEYNEYNRL